MLQDPQVHQEPEPKGHAKLFPISDWVNVINSPDIVDPNDSNSDSTFGKLVLMQLIITVLGVILLIAFFAVIGTKCRDK